MKRLVLFTTGAGLLLAACDTDSRLPTQPVTRSPAPQASRSQQGVPHGHVFRARRPAEASGRDNNPIQYHGGPIIYAQKVAAIYWSSRTIYNGGPAPGTTGPGTGDGSLLGFFLNHLGGSAYYNMNTT